MPSNINYDMFLSFLPKEITNALTNLNENLLTEIRVRSGQAVIIEYCGEYRYLSSSGATQNAKSALKADGIDEILFTAMGGNVFAYTEQLKRGYITVGTGIRIGIAGEYVTDNGKVTTIKSPTSLNIRLPHDIENCSSSIYETLFTKEVYSTLIFSPPGYGKTTILRDLAKKISRLKRVNVLIFDERREISGIDDGLGYDLGEYVDVVRCSDKLSAIENAIRAMKPQIIITDELYGGDDLTAVQYAADCGIKILASTHVTDREKLKKTPFSYFAELTGIGKPPDIYDKNFNLISDNCSYDGARLRDVNR